MIILFIATVLAAIVGIIGVYRAEHEITEMHFRALSIVAGAFMAILILTAGIVYTEDPVQWQNIIAVLN